MFLCLAALHVGILPWSSTRPEFLPPPIALFCIFLFIIIICTNFYLFNLCFGLLMSFLFQFVPVLYSTTVFLCLPTLHMVFLPWSTAGLRLPPSVLLWSYLFINHKLHFLLCLATAPVKISALMERLSSKFGKKLPLLTA